MRFRWIILTAILLAAPVGYLVMFGSTNTVQQPAKPSLLKDSEITYPVDAKQILNTELFALVKDISSNQDTRRFLFDGDKFPIDGAGNVTKLHPRTYELYERCMSLIAAEPEWAELYKFNIGTEILGLNSRLTGVNGEVDQLSQMLGRDFIYQVVDENMKYLMEGIDKAGADILLELLESPTARPEHHSHTLSVMRRFKNPASSFNKADAGVVVVLACGNIDIRLGLLGVGTNFQSRVASIADIVKKRVRQLESDRYEQRRDKLNKTIEALIQ